MQDYFGRPFCLIADRYDADKDRKRYVGALPTELPHDYYAVILTV